jgi:hypothetical protein
MKPEVHAQLIDIADRLGNDLTGIINQMIHESIPAFRKRANELGRSIFEPEGETPPPEYRPITWMVIAEAMKAPVANRASRLLELAEKKQLSGILTMERAKELLDLLGAGFVPPATNLENMLNPKAAVEAANPGWKTSKINAPPGQGKSDVKPQTPGTGGGVDRPEEGQALGGEGEPGVRPKRKKNPPGGIRKDKNSGAE